ncbi:MAG: hypothetical protein CMJ78_15355 [Planctomycetaceae bacterium]|nr:hypothetical protein [Planctomycetaceae bacterium]
MRHSIYASQNQWHRIPVKKEVPWIMFVMMMQPKATTFRRRFSYRKAFYVPRKLFKINLFTSDKNLGAFHLHQNHPISGVDFHVLKVRVAAQSNKPVLAIFGGKRISEVKKLLYRRLHQYLDFVKSGVHADVFAQRKSS